MNVTLGVLLHALGGIAAASFYIPLKQIKGWNWESFWFVSGFAAWLVSPIVASYLTLPGFWEAIQQTPTNTLALAFLFGLLWGIGGLTFGLSLRFLGVGLGYAVALGFTAVFGTLIPPLFDGSIVDLFTTSGGTYISLGIVVCVVGIFFSGWAGKSRDDAQSQTAESGSQFELKKGLVVAIVAGTLSACMAYGLAAGKPIAQTYLDIAQARGMLEALGDRLTVFQNNVVLVVVLWGGFTSNFVYVVWLFVKKGSWRDLTRTSPAAPRFRNYALAVAGGVMWFCQFFLYGMGSVKLGERYDFTSWILHMSFVIIFSSLWGWFLGEWKGSPKKTYRLFFIGLSALVLSTILVGIGNGMG